MAFSCILCGYPHPDLSLHSCMACPLPVLLPPLFHHTWSPLLSILGVLFHPAHGSKHTYIKMRGYSRHMRRHTNCSSFWARVSSSLSITFSTSIHFPALNCGWYTQWHPTGENGLFLSQQVSIASWLGVGHCVYFPSAVLGFCLEPVQDSRTLPQDSCVCVSPVVCGRRCFSAVIPSPDVCGRQCFSAAIPLLWLLQYIYLLTYIEPWVLTGGVRWKHPI